MSTPPPAPFSDAIEVPEGVCRQFLYRGRCRFPQCRFSHDVDALRALLPRPAPPAECRSIASAGGASSGAVDAEAKVAAAADDVPPRRSAWRSVDWLLQGGSVQENPYLREFAGAPWLQEVLDAPDCASLLNVRGKSLRKELTEAFGVLSACRRALRKLGFEPGAPGVNIVDLCSGKGFASLVMALSLPSARVLAVDANRNMELAHFRLRANLAFREVDITAVDAGTRIEDSIAEVGVAVQSVRVFVGVHLCGSLSQHAARLFREAPAPAALVLVPCCLDGRRVDIKRLAKRLRLDPHTLWCMTLLFDELPVGNGLRRELLVDGDVRSDRNSFLIAVRGPTEHS